MFALWNDVDERFFFSLDDNGGVKISEEEHDGLMSGQAIGYRIIQGADGVPVLSSDVG
ncbi:hypothetical protein ACTJKS_14845 [Pseudomonas sp. 22189]|uniref:hypothetical protein n=1 Tax=Pseudomonas sp. 22189 TaxID=3453889 RepID=UPI003F8364FE